MLDLLSSCARRDPAHVRVAFYYAAGSPVSMFQTGVPMPTFACDG